jgi:MoaA/NifB/PqqE/SkfB family radical SAM enzyme
MHVDTTGDVLPCCIAEHALPLGNVQNNTIEDIWNSNAYKRMRLNMMQDKPCVECSICYTVENRGLESVRQKKNKEYEHLLHLKNKTNSDGSLDQVHLHHFDIRWSNICNFKCRTCSASLSSSLAKEEQKLDPTIPIYQLAGGNTNAQLLEQFNPYFKDAETIYFAGGEPLMTEQHYSMLELLIAQKRTNNVALQYNSNLSILKYKDKSLFDLWRQFPDVSIRASLDSWGKRAEYIRHGTVWNDIENNILEIRNNLPHVRINTHTVVSLLNVGTLDEFLDYLLSAKLFDVENFYPEFYNLMEPDHFSVNALDPNTKERFLCKLERSMNKYPLQVQTQLHKVITWLSSSKFNSDLAARSKKEIVLRDTLRNQHIIDYLPELESYMMFDNIQER